MTREQYLRAFYLQNNWRLWLPLAELAANFQAPETPSGTLFYATYWFHTRMGFEPVTFDLYSPIQRDVEQIGLNINEFLDHVRSEFVFAQARS